MSAPPRIDKPPTEGAGTGAALEKLLFAEAAIGFLAVDFRQHHVAVVRVVRVLTHCCCDGIISTGATA